MLLHQIRRLNRSRLMGRLVVATSTDRSDNAIAALSEQHDVPVARGSLDDVLERMYQAALPYRPDVVVRLTGDCPLADWQVLDTVIEKFLQGRFDYVNNVDPPSYPHGLDVEVMSFAALEEAHREAVTDADREHVTAYVRARPDQYRIGTVCSGEEGLADMRWTVDEPADLEKVRGIYERLYPANPHFLMQDIIDLLAAEPALDAVNEGIRTRASGVQRSEMG